ncbi:hypothetical protein WOLCODRAFT_166443 [Wolfiporia cocos MD-104 SS10]|uniref:Uncharacterized protein n=1 Tax=Wolfiporia cocos (strain MD-104) TaxID=742152 RepID=A0A2H3J206_WOLCO|nr:hypothetical protein WOLCODRAFT_166443 [Wolfiporia cocos MD-104 SS10]
MAATASGELVVLETATNKLWHPKYSFRDDIWTSHTVHGARNWEGPPPSRDVSPKQPKVPLVPASEQRNWDTDGEDEDGESYLPASSGDEQNADSDDFDDDNDDDDWDLYTGEIEPWPVNADADDDDDTMDSSSSCWTSNVPAAEDTQQLPQISESFIFRGTQYETVRTIVRPNPRFCENDSFKARLPLQPGVKITPWSALLLAGMDMAPINVESTVDNHVPDVAAADGASCEEDEDVSVSSGSVSFAEARKVVDQLLKERATRNYFEEDVVFWDREWAFEKCGSRVEIWVTVDYEEHREGKRKSEQEKAPSLNHWDMHQVFTPCPKRS